jgi:hypothetical protein
VGRASVRAAIAAYFTPAAVGACLSTTYAARPKQIPQTAFKFSANGGSGAVLVVHLTTDDEHRVALGGAHSGGKFDVHDIALELKFQSVKTDAIAAQADHDALVDAVKTLLRADRTLGTGGVPIWQAGEDGDLGNVGIRFDMAEPVLTKQAVIIEGVLHFQAYEYLVS